MPRHTLQIAPALFVLLLFARCAQIVPLGGGKKDTQPPVLTEAVPPNKNIRFNVNEITLRFNEYVKLTDLSNQLIITPKLSKAPEIVAEGKKIKITLKRDDLAPSTTYRFNFGSAIADMHESNAMKSFEYIFSTGPHIDTLEMKGSVTDAFNNTSVKGVLVGLYDNKAGDDSLPYVKTPDYITRTGPDGSFLFAYLPPGTFEVFAFTDANKNLLYDGEAEKIAFSEKAVVPPADTIINLKLFQEEAAKTYIKKSTSPYYGMGQVVLNKKCNAYLKPLSAADSRNVFETNPGREKDTIIFYYKNLADTLPLLVVNKTVSRADTVKITLPRNSGTKRKTKNYVTNAVGGNLGLNERLKIIFPVWMDTGYILTTGIKISSKQDSVIKKEPVKGKWLDCVTFELAAKLKEGVTYEIKTDTIAFREVNGTNCDSNLFSFKTRSKADLGKLTLKLKVNKKQSYVLQLLSEQQKVVADRFLTFSLSSSNAVNVDFTDVLPGTYTVKLIYDDNENRKWDSGNLLAKKLPEQVFINAKQVKVLADWEVEEEIVVKE